MEARKNIGGIVNMVLKAVALGMGVSALVITVLGVAAPQTLLTLLAIGVACLALTALDKE